MVSNHQSYVEWVYTWCLLSLGGLGGALHIILKSSLRFGASIRPCWDCLTSDSAIGGPRDAALQLHLSARQLVGSRADCGREAAGGDGRGGGRAPGREGQVCAAPLPRGDPRLEIDETGK